MLLYKVNYLHKFEANGIMINVSDLTNKKVEKKSLDIELDIKKFQDGVEEFYVEKPLKLTGLLTRVGDIIYLDAKVQGVIKLECSRCLERFPYNIDLEIHEKLTNAPENKDEEIIFIENDSVNICEIVENNIIVSLPIKRLCKEDCKGLCPICGTNLNVSTCNCHEDNIDPRLEKLKELFSDR